MAKIRDIDTQDFENWLSTRPQIIRYLGKLLPPDRLYLLKTTGHRVIIYSYNEDGTVTVAVTGEYNQIKFPRKVFGISPIDLEECDLPGPDEPVGAETTDPKEIEKIIADINCSCNDPRCCFHKRKEIE
jgi:hypothetical protein